MATPRFAIAAACAGCMLFACTTVMSVPDAVVAPDSGVGTAEASASSSSSSSSGTVEISDASEDAPIDAHIDVEVGAPSSSGSSGTSGNTSSSSSSSGSTVVDAGPPVFTDDFDRANSTTIGDGWIAKTAGHFAIDDDALALVGTAADGYDNIELFRPETALDVQIDVDVTYPGTDTDASADPTLSARMSEASVTETDIFDGYAFYLTRGNGGISREEVNTTDETDLDAETISPALETGVAYHVTFTVTGTSTVSLAAQVTRDSDGAVMATFSATDATTTKYANAGRMGLGAGNTATGLRFDNYVRTTLP